MPCCRLTPLDAAFTMEILNSVLQVISLIGSLERTHQLEHAGNKDDIIVYRRT